VKLCADAKRYGLGVTLQGRTKSTRGANLATDQEFSGVEYPGA